MSLLVTQIYENGVLLQLKQWGGFGDDVGERFR